jgi:hypothetical protein
VISPATDHLPWFLDIEASGFGPGSYPIEVGFVAPDGHALCTLIRPEPDWTHWDSSAEQIHHVRRELLVSHGRTAVEVAGLLNRELAGHEIYSDCWAHDYVWLARLFEAADRSPRFQLHDLRELLDESEQARFDATRAEVRARSAQQRHRASTDARVLQMTVAALRGEALVVRR